MTRVLLVAAALACIGCTDASGARNALEQAGYSQISVGGYSWWLCDGKEDTFATKFTAVGPTGFAVSGAVCSGWLKGKTIRLN